MSLKLTYLTQVFWVSTSGGGGGGVCGRLTRYLVHAYLFIFPLILIDAHSLPSPLCNFYAIIHRQHEKECKIK